VAEDITPQITRDGIDFQLWFATRVLRLQSLHYGYWEDTDDMTLTLDATRKAQVRYTEYLVRSVPPGVHTILDVGCGIGCNARALASKGYKVTALSPDANHQQFFDDFPADQVRFCSSKYEEYSNEQSFDLVLMSESQNYFDADVGLAQTQHFLVPGGCLLVCGMFRKRNSDAFNQTRNTEGEYLLKAQRHGFELIERADITRNILPTLRMVRMAKNNYLDPALLAARQYGAVASWKMKAAALLFRKELRLLREIESYYHGFADPEFFAMHVAYLRLLFRRNKGSNVKAVSTPSRLARS
jgi:SAM-dependent methyltransferase